MNRITDWPLIGIDKDGDGKGEPVLIYKKPYVGKVYPIAGIAESDEFNSPHMGLQWQWQANPKEGWTFPTPSGFLRMFSVLLPDSIKSAWDYPNLFAQKFPAEEFTATLKFTFKPRWDGEKFAFMIHGTDYAYIAIEKKADGNYITYANNKEADKGNKETVQDGEKLNSKDIYFRVKVSKGAVCTFSYSADGSSFNNIGEKLIAKPGRWVGAKMGLFFTRNNKTNDAGMVDVDWFRVTTD